MNMTQNQPAIKDAVSAKAPADGAETKVSIEDYILDRGGEVQMIIALLNSMDACLGTGRDHIVHEQIQHANEVAESLRKALDISQFPDGPFGVPNLETPVEALFREWEAAREVEEHSITGDLNDEQIEALAQPRQAIEDRIANTPSQNPRDIILKILASTFCGEADLEARTPSLAMLWDEARAQIG
ncbi:hypothetical protein [Paracoccus sp. SCSIO 75233]|uniref:hypothetical protein n=1 Tax=Paracoccus sp. SCSIO 75233 TaxID=3017782 RepID=UPI0022EFF77B|nr:hypothetical protein [Paracoccus sp. SCSIO 75233]WBU51875.1 hypothetical protein PAF12_08435 [Paracoccus sp. SCSIO 75233]